MRPVPVSDIDLAFATDVIGTLLPKWESIPPAYKDKNHPTDMNRLVSKWFFEGLSGAVEFRLRDGIEKRAALRHLATCLGSFEPSHEHKDAGCAYLCALWFDEVLVNGESFKSGEAAQAGT
jgi:hypothetical protein